jgi:hypothetical protein
MREARRRIRKMLLYEIKTRLRAIEHKLDTAEEAGVELSSMLTRTGKNPRRAKSKQTLCILAALDV